MSNDRFLLLQIPLELKRAAIEVEYPVYASKIGNDWIAYRVLLYSEFKKTSKAKRILDNYSYCKYLLDLCLIYPKDINKIPALWIPKVGEHVEEVSGFDNAEAFYSGLEYSRQKLLELEPGVDIFLKTTLGLQDEKLDEMTFFERMRLVAFAELVSERQIPGPEEEKPSSGKKDKFDPKGIRGLGQKERNEAVTQVDKQGRPIRIQENESFSVYNTKLKQRE